MKRWAINCQSSHIIFIISGVFLPFPPFLYEISHHYFAVRETCQAIKYGHYSFVLLKLHFLGHSSINILCHFVIPFKTSLDLELFLISEFARWSIKPFEHRPATSHRKTKNKTPILTVRNYYIFRAIP